MRRHVSLYGLTVSLPLLIWQLLFFVFPLVFLIALSFWTVRNFRMQPISTRSTGSPCKAGGLLASLCHHAGAGRLGGCADQHICFSLCLCLTSC